MPLFLSILLLVVLLFVCAYLILIVLMQRASSNSGMGAALGGGAAESALGGSAGNVLTKGTIIGSIIFFVLCFGLYLGFTADIDRETPSNKASSALLEEVQREAGANAARQAEENKAREAAAPAAPSSSSLVEIPASLKDSAPAQGTAPAAQ